MPALRRLRRMLSAIRRRANRRTRQAGQPSRIRLEASSLCQLRCPSCPTTVGAIHPTIGNGFLRFEDFKALIDGNPSLESIELSNYGEALLNPHLVQILEYAAAKSVTVTLR